MCRANDKLTLFSYTLRKLVEVHKDFNQTGIPMSSDEALSTFSNTRIMKLLYCLCLESWELSDNKDYEKTPGWSDNLFGFFGTFSALPNGPVSLQIYGALDIVPGFVYKDGHYCGFRELTADVLNDFKKKYPGAVEMVDKAVLGLRDHMSPEMFKDRNKLIELTHQLPIWQETFMFKPNKEMSISSYDLKLEYEAYKNLIA